MVYDKIVGGLTSDAFQALTGGITTSINLNDPNIDLNSLWRKLFVYYESGYLLACGNPTSSLNNTQQITIKKGIIMGHAYSILSLSKVDGHLLLNLKNPWGDTEWEGDWSDNSPLWTSKLKKYLNFQSKNDGNFWMSFSDFILYFQAVYICRIFQDVIDKEIIIDKEQQIEQYELLKSQNKIPWYKDTVYGSWSIKEETAQGMATITNKNKQSDFSKNPQYKLSNNAIKPEVVLISLKQIPLYENNHMIAENKYIAIDIVNNNGQLITTYLKKKDFLIKQSIHTNQRK